MFIPEPRLREMLMHSRARGIATEHHGERIICRYCGKSYKAYKKGRTHCRNPECRAKEIKKQLDDLEYFIRLFCINKIEAVIELRFPGNDKLSRDAKIDSVSSFENELEETTDSNASVGVGLQGLIGYFKPVLWKEVKGNFRIKILKNGTVDPKILNETFTEIANPVIIGNNMIIKGLREK